jgi:hypothetical protein
MNVWAALGFMLLGGAIVELAEMKAWQRYKTGKLEGEHNRVRTEVHKR